MAVPRLLAALIAALVSNSFAVGGWLVARSANSTDSWHQYPSNAAKSELISCSVPALSK